MPTETRPPDFRAPGSAPRWRLGVGAAIIAALMLFAVLVVFSALGARGEAVSEITPTLGPIVTTSPAPSRSTGPTVFVHILGQIAAPGLYEVPARSRAVDVVAAAGGFSPDADQSALNLARTVSDGEQIVVPTLGDSAAAPEPVSGEGSAGAGPGAGVGSGGRASPVLVDLNTADTTALESLTGVGPATAAAILAWRDEHGRFESVDDLLDVTGIGEKKLDKLRDGVVVR